MIDLLISLVPFVTCLLIARSVIRHGIAGVARPAVAPPPADGPPATAARATAPTITPTVAMIDGTAVPGPIPPAWTALDDLQLDRLLKESSS